VVGEINFACRRCAACRSGLPRHCPTRRVMGILNADGAFAEYVAVPAANLHAVPDGVSDDAAVFSEPLAAAFEILEQVRVERGTACVVLGDGKLGLLAAQVLAQAGARVLAVGKHDDKLAILRRRGIETVPLQGWDRARADLVVEATGSAAGFALAVAATRPRGTLVLKSTVADGVSLNLAPLVIDEITVVGSRCGPFAPALGALADGRVDVTSLIAARHRLADGLEALHHAAQPGVLKVLIEP
jgi:threonine dehydrogenase-like Zn-dependent dehydrogenase